MVDAVLFDWEGVLADTAGRRRDALTTALAGESVSLDATTHAALCAGQPSHTAIANVFHTLGRRDDTRAALVALRASRVFSARLCNGFALVSGASAFTRRLQLATRIAIVTTASRSDTEFVLRLAELESTISMIVSADDDLDAPPAPSAYQRALDGLSRVRPVRRAHVVAIASCVPALRAARAAGIRTIALGAPAHVSLEADGAVDSLDGLGVRDLARLARVPVGEHHS